MLVEALATNKTLTRIDLSANGITSVAASAIAVMLSKNDSVTRLDLRHNDLGDAGASTLASALKVKKRVKLIFEISGEWILTFTLPLKGRCVLQHLDLSANSIGHKVRVAKEP